MLLALAAGGLAGPAEAQEPGHRETPLAAYQKDANGGFSQRWVAYIIEPKEEDKDKSYSVELNGRRLGPYSGLSRRFEVSPDGEHIAFAAEKRGRWSVVLDGEERWTHKSLLWPWQSWTPTLEGNSFVPQTQAALLLFSPSGDQLAYPAELDDGRVAVFVNGRPGPAFTSIGTQITFVGGKVNYTAWTDEGIVKVHGDTVLGPYAESRETMISGDGGHFVFYAKDKGKHLLAVDGRVRELPGEVTLYEIGPGGEVAYSYRSGEAMKVHFAGRDLPGEYDEVVKLAISPDGKHLAFFGRVKEKWSFVTDTKTYPGFDGYFYYVSGGEEYSVMWGPESKSVAYFARDAKKRVLAIDGERQPFAGLPGVALQVFVDGDGTVVGENLMQGPRLDRQGFVQSFLSRGQTDCDPLSAVLVGGRMTCIQSSEKGSTMVIGERREGPYEKIRSVLLASGGNKHYAYVVSNGKGEQVVIDGRVMPPVYEAIYRPFFSGESEFAHLGVKEGKVFRVSYSLSAPN